MTTFDLNSRPAALIRDTTNTTRGRRELVWQPLRAFPSLKPGDCLTVTLEAPEWARSVIAMQTTPNPSAGHFLALEVGGLDVGGMGAPLPTYPGHANTTRTARGVIVSDSVRLNLSLSTVPAALDVRLVFLDH